MMKRILLYIFLLTGFAANAYSGAVATCSGRGGDDGDENTAVFDYFFHEAQRQHNAHNYDAAFDLFNFCYTLNPNSGAVLYELSSLYKYLRNDSLSISHMERAVRLYPDNYWYKDQLVKLYYDNKQIAEAQATLEQMATQFPEKEDVLMMLLDLYTANSDYDNVIKTIEKIEVKEGKSEQLSIEKFRIYLKNNDEKSAFREMKALADEYPNDVRYQVLIGDLYLDQGKPAEALKVYNKVAEKEPDNINLALSMMSYCQKQGLDSLYDVQLEKLITHPSLDSESRMRLVGSIAYENLQSEADSSRTIRIFEKALSLEQEDNGMYELYVSYMANKKMPASQIKPVLYKMLEIDPENDMARNQLLIYAVEENDDASIIRVCKPAVEYSSDNPLYYYYLGVAYYQADSTQLAIDAFRKGVEKNRKQADVDVNMMSNMYTLLGDLYHKQGMEEQCFEVYDSCLIYRPDDALVLNNYAYYLSLAKKDLARAEQMSRRSLEMDADNPTYLDTLAWILYMQKRYAEAKEVMDKTAEILGERLNDDDNATLREHIEQINSKLKKK